MNRVLAIVRKDFLRVRWYVAVWIAFALLELGLGANQLFGHVLPFRSLQLVITAIHYGACTLTFLIAGLIVQTDRVTGATASWVTRPISPFRLCIAKYVGVFFITVAIPVLVYSGWWLALRFTARDFAWAAIEIAGFQCVVAFPAMMMGALTDTFTRFVVWSLVAAVVAVVGPIGWIGAEVFQVRIQGVGGLRVIVLIAMLVVTTVAATTLQMWRRTHFTSIAMLVCGVFGTVYVGVKWRDYLNWVGDVLQPSSHATDTIGREITLEFNSAKIDDRFRIKSSHWTTMDLNFDVRRLPEEYSIAAGDISQKLEWPSGLKMNVSGRFIPPHSVRPVRLAIGLRDPVPDPETEAWWTSFYAKANAERKKRGYPPIIRGSVYGFSRAEIVLPVGVADFVPTLHPTYRTDLELRILHPRVVLEVPLTPGAWIAREGVALRILGSMRVDGKRNGQLATREGSPLPTTGLKVSAVYGVPSLIRDDIVRPFEQIDQPSRLIVINRTTGDSTGSYRFRDASVVIGLVGIASTSDGFPDLPLRRGDTWIPRDPQFLDHGSLVYVKHEEVARIRRQVVVDHLDPEVLRPGAYGSGQTSIASPAQSGRGGGGQPARDDRRLVAANEAAAVTEGGR